MPMSHRESDEEEDRMISDTNERREYQWRSCRSEWEEEWYLKEEFVVDRTIEEKDQRFGQAEFPLG